MKFKRAITSVMTAVTLTTALHVAAANTVEKVGSVSTAVKLTNDVDYIITSSTPFGTGGSVDIVNTDHAVLIFYKVLPSEVTDDGLLKKVKINGVQAQKGVNCQVKMYNQGSIILPYEADCNPLTVYSEPNFQGTSTSSLPLETFDETYISENEYMKTLTNAQLNNQISSFKLKRGYMVTFAVGNEGWGYSRCFIAADEDLEVAELPAALNNRISSYRLFVWNDCQKKGVASTDAATLQTLNASSTYGWGPGSYMGEDYEMVPHVIKLGWPGNCGTHMHSCYLKTNNEPGNSVDDGGYEAVEKVLATWEDMMRTGKRLLSPSSHDGSLSWMQAFMDSIDAKGWRCDIVDMHCYWTESNLNSGLASYYNKYKRPIWISEFVYGSSWGPAGIFSYAKNNYGSTAVNNADVQAENLRAMSGVFNNWNSYDYIERYFFWNSEAICSRLIVDGELTQLGEFYRDMDTGLGYNKNYDYVPKVVVYPPYDLAATYDEETLSVTATWGNKNRGLTDEMYVEMLWGDEWQVMGTVPQDVIDDATTFTYTFTLPDDFIPASNMLRIHSKEYDSSDNYSATVAVDIYREVEGYNRITFMRGTDVLRMLMLPDGTPVSAPGEGFDTTGILKWTTDITGFNDYDFSQPVTSDLVLYALEQVNELAGWDANGSTTTTPEEAGWICSGTTMTWDTVITGTTSIAAYRDNLDGISRAFIRPGKAAAIFAYPVYLYSGTDYTLSLGHAGMNGKPVMNYAFNTEPDNSGKSVATSSATAPQWSSSATHKMSFSVANEGLYYFTWQSDYTDRNFIFDLTLTGGSHPVTVSFVTNCPAEVDPVSCMTGAHVAQPVIEHDYAELVGWYLDPEFTQPFDFGDPITADTTIYAFWSYNLLAGWDADGEEATPQDAGWICTDEAMSWALPGTSPDWTNARYRDNLEGMGRTLNRPQTEAAFAYPVGLELEQGESYTLSLTTAGFAKGNQTFGICTNPDGTGVVALYTTEATPVWGSTASVAYKFDCTATGQYYFVWYSDIKERSFITNLLLKNSHDSSIIADYPMGGLNTVTVTPTTPSVVNVYSITGVCLKTNVDPATALDDMPRGFYIVGGKKVIK